MECSDQSCLDGNQSAMSNGTNTVAECSNSESKMAVCPERLSTRWTSENLTDESLQSIKGWLMSLQLDSPANRSPLQESEKGKATIETCGQRRLSAFAWYDRDSACWRTYQASFAHPTGEPYSETWPRAGSVSDGVCYRRPKWERRIRGIGFGSLLPTIGVNEYKGSGKYRYRGSPHFRGAKMSEGLRICETDPIYLHPSFAEHSMGWPVMWTELKPLATAKFQQWLELHGSC